MLCVEDALDGLAWAERVGGLPALVRALGGEPRRDRGLGRAHAAGSTSWRAIPRRAPAPRSASRSSTRGSARRTRARAPRSIKNLVALLEQEGVALDVASYRDAPPGLRIWGGATVEREDIEALLPWLDWAWGEVRGK